MILRGWGQACVTRHTLVRGLSEKGERGSKAVISENGLHLTLRGRKIPGYVRSWGGLVQGRVLFLALMLQGNVGNQVNGLPEAI